MDILKVLLIAYPLCCVCNTEKGSCFHPPNGTDVSTFEGSNSTITCNFSTHGDTCDSGLTTTWSVLHLNGSNGPQAIASVLSSSRYSVSATPRHKKYNNSLTIYHVSQDLNGATIFCHSGIQSDKQLAWFTMRIYTPPRLTEILTLKIRKGDHNVSVALLNESFDFSDNYLRYDSTWSKDGHILNDGEEGIGLGFSSILFNQVRVSDSGNYSLLLISYLDNNTSWSGSGGFILHVLYGPDVTISNRTEYTILLGNDVSLVCGKNLRSNPQASITWQRPNGETVNDMDHGIHIDNGPDIVRINISHVSYNHSGMWNCTVSVSDSDVYRIDEDGLLVSNSRNVLIGFKKLDILLIVLSPPGQPYNLMMFAISDSWVSIQWETPNNTGSHGISYYNITVHTLDVNMETMSVIWVVTENNETRKNITLLPGTSIKMQVTAISTFGGLIAVGPASEPLVVNTSTNDRDPHLQVICERQPRLLPGSRDDVMLVVHWYYQKRHTEEFGLKNFDISYTISINDVEILSTTPTSSMSDSEQRSVNLTISRIDIHSGTYIVKFNVTASNLRSSLSISCPSLVLEEKIIQLVLSGVLGCSQWVILNTDEKLKIILNLLHENCNGCAFVITNHAIECATDDSDVVKFRAKLFSTPNTLNEMLNSIKVWITNNPSMVVKGLRLYFKTNCPLVIDSFETPLRCINEARAPENSVALILAIAGFTICAILTATVVILVIYIVQKQRHKNQNNNTDNQPSEYQLPVMNVSRANTMSRVSIPETIPEIQLDGCEKCDHEDFELSASLAYGTVTPTSNNHLHCRPASDVESAASDIEFNYNNPIYDPVYETILPNN